MGKSFILFLMLIVLISGCVQPLTGRVVLQPQENVTVQKPTSQPTNQTQPTQNATQQTAVQDFTCKGTAGCFYGNVTRIIDGDTIEADGNRVRLVLVDAPESSQVGGFEATNFIYQNCPVGSQVILDQDDLQLYDNYGRMLAVAWCHSKRLNEEIIAQGYANIYYEFCSQSEFGDDNWAVRLGCTEPQDCDPSYPTLCIPPPPPDLDCSDISDRRFEVRPPDPHRFDGDKDGIGCEN